jgi:hypothetical protein
MHWTFHTVSHSSLGTVAPDPAPRHEDRVECELDLEAIAALLETLEKVPCVTIRRRLLPAN